MSSSRNELPLNRLSTADERGRRIYLYPADVRGWFRTWRTRVNWVLLVIFLALPWVRINGHPAVLLDIPGRRFALFGIGFWAHEAPMLVFVFGAAILALALVTAIWGRVWCGWACPQTVFVDAIFRKIERWVEGDSVERRRLDEGELNADKIFKKSLKWGLFALVSLVISHSFLAYFVGTEALRGMVQSSPAQNPGAFLVMAGMFALVMFDFGWFREQFCTVLCPYGRFQSVLMDDRSQVVAYDAKRGEPRRGKAEEGVPQGDCVNCYRCVQVCPTGIDIRRGLQLECIACTACMDACDDVMTKLKRPKGLIRYSKGSGSSARPWIYGGILFALLAGLGFALSRRHAVEVTLIRAAEAPYQDVGGGQIVNHFKLDLQNQSFENAELRVDLSPELKAAGAKLVLSNFVTPIEAGETERADLFVEFPKSVLNFGKKATVISIRAELQDETHGVQANQQEVLLVGPFH